MCIYVFNIHHSLHSSFPLFFGLLCYLERQMSDNLLLPQPNQRSIVATDRRLLIVQHPSIDLFPFRQRASPKRQRLEQVDIMRYALIGPLDEGSAVDKRIR